jgi:2-isopropylmalate synthase
MDASRAEPGYLYRIIEVAINSGAATINIPDTVGYSIPTEFGELIHNIMLNVPNIHKATISVHCHNDLGLAVANSLAALAQGARQVECTINGIGERAGNAALEEIVMALNVRHDILKLTTNIDTTQINKTSRLVSELIGFPVQPNKAIVGANAFSHQSGIHQDGLIKKAITYEIMDPKLIGLSSSNLVLGKSSGRHAFKERLAELGYTLSENELKGVFQSFKDIADKTKEVTDRDIESLIAEELRTTTGAYRLDHVEVVCGDHSLPTATVRLISPDGQNLADAALGTGPVDAIYKAINRIVNIPNKLTEFTIKSVTGGIDAIGEVLIKIESDGITYTGRGASTDIIVASAKAYMNALNRLINKRSIERERTD